MTKVTAKVASLDRGEVLRVFKERLESELVKGLDSFNADHVAKEITRQMRAQQNDLVFKVLGVNSNYNGNFEIDHCNGREPIITEFLKEQCGEDIKQVMLELTKAELAKLRKTANAKLKAAVVDELNRTWNNVLHDKARDMATTLVNSCANEVKNEILGDSNVNH